MLVAAMEEEAEDTHFESEECDGSLVFWETDVVCDVVFPARPARQARHQSKESIKAAQAPK